MDRPGKVLIMEDDVDLRHLMSKALRGAGYQVSAAIDGHQALELIEAGPCPEVILLDLSMPGMNGTDFMKILKNQSKCSKARTIVVSGWEKLADVAKEIGADGCIRKPIDLENLYKEVETQFAALRN